MAQTWHNLLFAHWPVPLAALRPLVPAPLEIDTFDGQAWIGIVAFRLSRVRLRGLPPVAGLHAFPEINVRTYVRVNGKPGVLFLSLDANNRPAMALARPWFHLAYRFSAIRFEAEGDTIRFESRCPTAPAGFSATYQPTAAPAPASPGTLPHWLTERYCYYSVPRAGRAYRCDIHHEPWPLQPATATIEENTMAAAHGLPLPAIAPILHYARQMQAVVWPIRRLAGRPSSPELRVPHWARNGASHV
jgi:uncharacterized protein YqjF (DUF2071 family)